MAKRKPKPLKSGEVYIAWRRPGWGGTWHFTSPLTRKKVEGHLTWFVKEGIEILVVTKLKNRA